LRVCECYVCMYVRPVCQDAAPVDVVFAVDSSGSISREDFEQVIELVGAVVQSLTIHGDLTPNGFQVALISFADETYVRFYLDTFTDKQLMLAAVNARYTHGRTNVSEALRYSPIYHFSLPTLYRPPYFIRLFSSRLLCVCCAIGLPTYTVSDYYLTIGMSLTMYVRSRLNTHFGFYFSLYSCLRQCMFDACK